MISSSTLLGFTLGLAASGVSFCAAINESVYMDASTIFVFDPGVCVESLRAVVGFFVFGM